MTTNGSGPLRLRPLISLETSRTGFWLPYFERSTIPIQQPPPPFTISENSPDTSFGDWAVKIEQTGGVVDWSISYYNGFNLLPDLGLTPPTNLVLEIIGST